MREEISEKELYRVEQICTDMSPTMECICNALFTKAQLVTDRFHVMKNLLEDVGSVRIAIKATIKNTESRSRRESKER
jgi:transposase